MRGIRNKLNAETLKKLYWENHLSLAQIGRIFHCATRTIHIKMLQSNIPLRSPGLPKLQITKAELEKLYVEQRLSSRKIAIIYNCAYSAIDQKVKLFGFPTRTRAVSHIITKRLPFSGNMQEKAYLIGFRIGDLRVRKRYKNSETILIDCGSTKSEQIDLIRSLFSKYGNVWVSKPNKSGKTQIECFVDRSFSFLLNKPTQFPKWAFNNQKLFLSLLAGFTDAEGSFFVTKDGKASAFSIGNYNKFLLLQLKERLSHLLITSRLFRGVQKGYRGKDGYAHQADYWILSIDRKADVYYFTTLIKSYLRHKKKIQDVQRVLDNIATRNARYGYINMPAFLNREIFYA